MKPFSLKTLSGGLNTSDPPSSLPDDQAVEASNVEFWNSACGERRKGSIGIDLPIAITGNPLLEAVTFLYRHLPTTNEEDAQLWILAQNLTSQNYVLAYKDTTWHVITPTDAIDVTNGRGFEVSAQTLHGKLFIAYRSVGGIDRLHVWDGISLRRCGLAEPDAPTVTDTLVGTFTGTRYYRQRYTVQVAGITVLRSEPSETTTFIPSGTGLGARITKGASIGEGETHWEIEASVDNANFYRIFTEIVGTTTYNDNTDYSPGYATLPDSVLSADIGDYALIHSAKYLTADQDRLLVGSAWEDTSLASRVTWTPVFGDTEGIGNDERIETDTDPYVDLDGFEGGPLTFLSNPVNGYIYGEKRSHTYRLSRTGQRNRAYEATNISKRLGAIPGSVIEGVDQYGMPCLYFLDPETGPCRTGGTRLIQAAGRDILNTWASVNTNAIVVARAVYYPMKQQVHWWVATDDSDFPSFKIILHTADSRETPDGVRRGWVTADGKIARAYSTSLFSDNIDDNGERSLILKPFIGVSAADGYILRCDTEADDDGEDYYATLTSKPFIVASLFDKFGTMAAALLGKAHDTASVSVTLTRDFGIDEKTTTTDLVPEHAEEHVIKQLRNMSFSQLYALQITFEDVEVPNGVWEINRFDLKFRDEDKG